MGMLFSKKPQYWVPEHRKLNDLLEDPGGPRWKTATDLTGWQLQNSLTASFADAVIATFATTEVNISFNGLGDDECEVIARVSVLWVNSLLDEPSFVVSVPPCASLGQRVCSLCHSCLSTEWKLAWQVMKQSKTVKRLILENNHIHAKGAQYLAEALTPEEGKVPLARHCCHLHTLSRKETRVWEVTGGLDCAGRPTAGDAQLAKQQHWR
jgi:hypothetical protein